MRLFLSQADLARQAAVRPEQYLQELDTVIAARSARGVWIDTTLPAYAALLRKYGSLHPDRPGPSQKIPADFRPEDWHLDSHGTPGRCCE